MRYRTFHPWLVTLLCVTLAMSAGLPPARAAAPSGIRTASEKSLPLQVRRGLTIAAPVTSSSEPLAALTIHQNNIYANDSYGLQSAATVDATQNWWGHETGPTHSTNPAGRGEEVSDNVVFDPWLDDEVAIGIAYPPYAGPPQPGAVIIANNTFEDNSYGMQASIAQLAEYNWWGDASGPHHASLNPAGTGNRVGDNVDFSPWLSAPPVPPPSEYQTAHGSAPSSRTDAKIADPVSVVFGNYSYQHTDLAIEGRGPHLALERTYNSASPADGPLGFGWTHRYAITLTQETASTLLIRHGDGRLDRFADDGSGNYTPPPGIYSSLDRYPDGTATLTEKDQTAYTFDAAGRLAAIADRNGNTLSLGYANGLLTSITDATGRTLTLSYNGRNRITQVVDPAGRTVGFGYNGDGDLVTATDARGQVTSYTYDSAHRLTRITDANGHAFVMNSYDAEGRVAEQRDALNNVTTFLYDRPVSRTTVTDPLGRSTVYTYDAQWRVTGVQDGLGHTETYTYDANDNRLTVTNRNGHTTAYAYDHRSNTTAITDAIGGVTTMTYDTTGYRNNLLSQTDALGRTTAYTYDTHSNLTGIQDALGHVTSYSYDSLGQMISAIDANGHPTQYGYDAHGYRETITDALGHFTSSTYDIAGRLLSETDPNGNTTGYTYDANNNLLTITDALGGVTSKTYDPVGNLLAETDALGRTTTFAYDVKDRLISTSNALGGVTSNTYDAANNRLSTVDANGHTTTFSYDAANQLIAETDPLGHVTTYAYDPMGNRTGVTDPNGHTTTSAYDALNRLVHIADPLGHSTVSTYDAAGNLTMITDAAGRTTTYGYDALNRLIAVTDALSGTVAYAYDPAGNRTAVTDANGHTTSFTYDPVDRLASVSDALGNTTSYAYDSVGNRTSLADANGATTAYSYDALNRLVQITYPTSGVAYTYDAAGNRLAMTDSTGTTTYTYDALNRLVQVVDGAGRAVGYAYDAVGNRIALVYPGGDTVTYGYDAADRMIRATDWSTRTTSYAYDPAGNLASQSNPNGTAATYTYDAANRLTSLVNTSPSGVLSSFTYTLDAMGNRTQIAEANGDVTTYTYDALYRLAGVHQQLKVDFNTNCAVDAADVQRVADAWYSTDPAYDLTGDGHVRADDINLVTSRWNERCEQAAYIYDGSGNRTSLTTPDGALAYAYDAADRLVSISDGTAFTWDANGNQLSKGSTTYGYDTANRLVESTRPGTTVQFVYHGDGVRVRKTAGITVTEYLQDVAAPLPIVLLEHTAGGDTRYIYGPDLIASVAPDGSPRYFHVDGLGSTRNLTDRAGREIGRYSYEAFGALRAAAGSAETDFLFAGEQTDSELGLTNLRSRSYDYETGRFIQRDATEASVRHPQTWHRYVYVYNRPVGLVDPFGLWGISPRIGIGGSAAFLGGTDISGGIGPELEFPSWNPLDWRFGGGVSGEGKITTGAHVEASPDARFSAYLWERQEPGATFADNPLVTTCVGGGGGLTAGAGIGVSGGVCSGQGKTGLKISGSLKVGGGGGGYGFGSVGTGTSWTVSPREFFNALVNVGNWLANGINSASTASYRAQQESPRNAAMGAKPSSMK